jgi:hypothetical protein
MVVVAESILERSRRKEKDWYVDLSFFDQI